MNYEKAYSSIIDRAKNRILDEYSEKHHITPKCLGGSNAKDNMVALTYREHFICHWLLVKIHPDNHKLKAAFAKMLEETKNKKRIVCSRYFDIVKRNIRDIRYEWLIESWKTPWNKGKKGVQVAWNKGVKTGPMPQDVIDKRSDSIRERYKTETHFNKGKDPWNKGKKGSQVAWNKGVSPEKSPCVHCGKLVDAMNMKRWHGDKCKNK